MKRTKNPGHNKRFNANKNIEEIKKQRRPKKLQSINTSNSQLLENIHYLDNDDAVRCVILAMNERWCCDISIE